METATTSPAPQAPKAPTGPPEFGLLTVTPDNGHGRQQVFTVRLQRTPGSPAPALVGFLVSQFGSGSDACYVFNFPGTQRLLLVNDSGIGSQEILAGSTGGNKQCEVVSDQPASSVAADAVTATFHVRFKPRFTGAKVLFAVAQDGNGVGTGLHRAGQFKLD